MLRFVRLIIFKCWNFLERIKLKVNKNYKLTKKIFLILTNQITIFSSFNSKIVINKLEFSYKLWTQQYLRSIVKNYVENWIISYYKNSLSKRVRRHLLFNISDDSPSDPLLSSPFVVFPSSQVSDPTRSPASDQKNWSVLV